MKIKTLMKNLLQILVNLQPKFIHFVRIAIAVVMLWIGGLKAFQYEADGIVPFVTNSPFMSFSIITREKLISKKTGQK